MVAYATRMKQNKNMTINKLYYYVRIRISIADMHLVFLFFTLRGCGNTWY